ncbi:MAG: hemolysin III family protein [Bradyrhizobiaceae bacterium]|nr:hemolysin III family protein [Bradyrhizobiaceae bacterium]
MIRATRLPASFKWNYDRVELIADAVVHAVGVILGLIGAIAIVIIAALSATAAKIPSVVIYAVGLLAMLGLSAAYNMWPISRVKWILQRFDHSAIYIMIAGTYTPLLGQLKDSVASVGLLAGVWTTASVGVALKLLMPGRLHSLAIVLYLFMGWSCAVAYGPITAALPPVCLGLIAAGGLLYSTGVVFHLWQNLRFHNAIWHGFVLLAACCHYTAVLQSGVFVWT